MVRLFCVQPTGLAVVFSVFSFSIHLNVAEAEIVEDERK